MTPGDSNDVERTLREALAARAQSAVGDNRVPPPLELTPGDAGAHRRGRFLAPLAAAAAVLLAVGLVVALRASSTVNGHAAGPAPAHSTAASPGPSHPTTPRPLAAPVHVSLKLSDGAQVGVGMPVIATFNKKVTNAAAFERATTVTVNGAPADGNWYFEYSDPASGHAMEAHYRLKNYWPAHARIHVALPVKGLSAGTGLAFDDSLTLDFTTGRADIAVVSDATHTLSLTVDGRHAGTYPVSLGASNTRTRSGVKVIMEKGVSICMSGPGYSECGVKYTQRLTYDGEYLHAAPWNVYNIQHGIDSSNGCTNLLPADAQKLYSILEIGDVVEFPDANGGKMQLGQGYGDWNVPWAQWQTGGAVPIR
jgi:lipoprotein-anchoring transpeptidase ErfK/SrfK